MNELDYYSYNWLAKKINNDSLRENLHHLSGKVIDLGCGSCPYREDILKVADSYTGVDWENCLHDQNGIDVFANICGRLPFDDDYAETLVSFQVMEHLPGPLLFLEECCRILKPGGVLFITVPFMWGLHEEPNDYYRFTRYALVSLLERAGLEPVSIKATTGFWQTWILKFNYYTARLSNGHRLVRKMLIPLWFAGQVLAPVIDRFFPDETETGGYTATARKPAG